MPQYPLIFIIILWICLPHWLKAQDLSQKLNSLLDAAKQTDSFNGIVLIAQDKDIIYSRNMGYADFKNQVKLDLDTPMPLSSITKSFTSTAILMLAERGQLNYDDPLQKYFPEFPDAYKEINIYHLAYHTSGWKRLYDRAKNKEGMIDIPAILDFLVQKKPKLSFKPGTQFLYNNIGYVLLAAIIEKVSGKSFATFLEEEIFQPLQLENTFLLSSETWERPRAFSHNEKNQVEEWFLGSYPGGIGIYASANDLLKWGQSFEGNTLLSDTSIKKTYQRGTLNDGSKILSSLVWTRWKGQENLYFKGGDWVGNESFLFRDLKKKISIIILANRKNKLSKFELMNQIHQILGYDDL